LPPGPFKPLLEALHRLQQADDPRQGADAAAHALVTARGAPAHERAVRTLMDWNIHVDEAMFLGGLDKGPFLREFEPTSSSTTRRHHVQSAARHVAAGHVPHGWPMSNAFAHWRTGAGPWRELYARGSREPSNDRARAMRHVPPCA
jgi:5'-nucleotidase